ncbi:MAG TPA: PIN domain-containing protein [Puia sp.]|jgi:multisubunit Na+/H+ antiporter MnhE subunit|nr:PIN domain-containing protein [Puia sp.]
MAFRIFLDADVLLDFTLKRGGYPIIRRLMQWVIAGRVQVFISLAILRDIAPELRRAYGVEQAQQLLLTLIASVQIIDAGYEVAVTALQSKIDNIPGAISYHTALHHRLDYFITLNTELLQVVNPVLPATTPIEFLNKHAAQLARIN